MTYSCTIEYCQVVTVTQLLVTCLNNKVLCRDIYQLYLHTHTHTFSIGGYYLVVAPLYIVVVSHDFCDFNSLDISLGTIFRNYASCVHRIDIKKIKEMKKKNK